MATESMHVIQKAQLQVSISEDKLSAFLYLSPQISRPAPTLSLSFQTKDNKSVIFPYTEDDVYAILRQEGIIHGILPEVIRTVISQAMEQTVVIAQGTKPVPGVEESVEEYFTYHVERNKFTEENGRINFREHQIIPQVKTGDLLAQIKPAIPGQPGCTVTGEEIPTPKLKTLKLHAKAGVSISDGNKVFATVDGRPVVEGDRVRYYSVVRQFVHNEDVTMKTGNLAFTGDLIINGNICESMSITATGHITVSGNVYTASIRAGHGITVWGSAQGSTIVAACGATAFYSVATKISQLNHAVHQVLKKLLLFQQRTGTSQPEQLGKVVLLIMEKDFPHLSDALESVTVQLEKELKTYTDIPMMITELVERLQDGLAQLRKCPQCSISDALDFMKGVSLLADYFKMEHAPLGDITLRNVNNCQIITTGKVVIIGEECFHTNIQAMQITARCVVRGGVLEASEVIEVNEVGSSLGIESTLRVPLGKRVKINFAYENTIVFIGERKYHFQKQKHSVILPAGI